MLYKAILIPVILPESFNTSVSVPVSCKKPQAHYTCAEAFSRLYSATYDVVMGEVSKRGLDTDALEAYCTDAVVCGAIAAKYHDASAAMTMLYKKRRELVTAIVDRLNAAGGIVPVAAFNEIADILKSSLENWAYCRETGKTGARDLFREAVAYTALHRGEKSAEKESGADDPGSLIAAAVTKRVTETLHLRGIKETDGFARYCVEAEAKGSASPMKYKGALECLVLLAHSHHDIMVQVLKDLSDGGYLTDDFAPALLYAKEHWRKDPETGTPGARGLIEASFAYTFAREE